MDLGGGKKKAKISVDRRKRRLEKQQVFLANSLPSNERSRDGQIEKRASGGFITNVK